MERDALTRLFDMHQAHCAAQLGLARKLLELGEAEARRKTLDDKLFAGGLDDLEKQSAETRFASADDQVSELRDRIKELVENLTGVPLSRIQEANL